MSTLLLRQARHDDLPGLQTLYRQFSPSSPEPDEPAALAAWQALLADPKIHVLVAERGELLGTVTLVVVPNLTQGAWPYALIENVVTHADARGQGIGTALMSRAVDLGRALGAYKVMLVTGRRAPEVHRLYAKSGLRSGATAYFARLDKE
ncbi:GNAT family N-acetyltransferase [Deinococcus apachensis]|uniref:GNAT family N-acetyltransferase n=1 Tax=Deinococcus apachensis TaxID=309886 RepID=UPI000369989B|nr:GNAT family N-acetyltransferase [Deinococcus apachensis]